MAHHAALSSGASDWVGWLGKHEDIVNRTFITTTYGHW
jgi:hypothetical protein